MNTIRLLPDGRMNRQDAAKYLGCSAKTLAMWACEKKGPRIVRVGGRCFYYKKDLDALKAVEKFPRKPRKRGRPRLAPSDRVGSNLTFRSTKTLRGNLIKAAKKEGRSASQEIRYRLERSFLMDDVSAWLDKRMKPDGD